MLSIVSIAQRSPLRYHQLKHPLPLGYSKVMSFSTDPSRPSSSAIARSMSRYRGNRQPKASNAPPLPKGIPNGQQDSAQLPQSHESYSRASDPRKQPSSQEKGAVWSQGRERRRLGQVDERQPRDGEQKPSTADSSVNGAKQDADTVGLRRLQQNGGRRGEHRPRTANHGSTREGLSTNRAAPHQLQSGQDEINEINTSPLGRTVHPKGGEQLSKNTHQSGNVRSPQASEFSLNSQARTTDQKGTLAPVPKTSQKKSFAERMTEHISRYNAPKNGSEALKRIISSPIMMDSGNTTASAGFDAPVSAVNAGERRVIVKCKDFSTFLPVTPSTTAADIVSSVSKQKPDLADATTSILLESYKPAGLERPLRKYERIRDVLNSWDSDAQNTLIVAPSSTGGIDDDLDIRHAPNEQPADTTVYLYYSQKPGHWDKRWVTMRTDGQVTIKKNGNEATNICHLSDFDIYVPTPRQLAKKIKPPKKVCFAVKSQQKSNMFLSATNFVHFFSTSDKSLATSWFQCIQQWRSWYLVHVMELGTISTIDSKVAPSTPRKRSASIRNANGSLQPFKHFADSASQLANAGPGARPLPSGDHAQSSGSCASPGARKASKGTNVAAPDGRPESKRSAPPISFLNKATNDGLASPTMTPAQAPPLSQDGAGKPSEQDPFSKSGLLGRSYSLRQRAVQSRDGNVNSSPTYNIPLPSAPVNAEPTSLKRGPSQRQKPKPLIDLTPQYQEPPQHSRKGKGVKPNKIPVGGLVDIATSPEVAIQIPPTKTWRRVGDEAFVGYGNAP